MSEVSKPHISPVAQELYDCLRRDFGPTDIPWDTLAAARSLVEQLETLQRRYDELETKYAASYVETSAVWNPASNPFPEPETRQGTGRIVEVRERPPMAVDSDPATSPGGEKYDERKSELDVPAAEAGWTGAPDPAKSLHEDFYDWLDGQGIDRDKLTLREQGELAIQWAASNQESEPR